MTRYYKQLSENGELVLLLTYDFIPNITSPLIVEITQEEYEQFNTKICESSDVVFEVING